MSPVLWVVIDAGNDKEVARANYKEANVTPIEATKYRSGRKMGSGYKKSSKGGFF